MYSAKTPSGDYKITFGLNYNSLNIALDLTSPINTFSGTNKLIVLNQGELSSNPGKVTIQISII